jgi:hypothetical protein
MLLDKTKPELGHNEHYYISCLGQKEREELAGLSKEEVYSRVVQVAN